MTMITHGRRTAWLLIALTALVWAGCRGSTNNETGAPAQTAQSANAGAADTSSAADWCAGHGLPESKCTKCNPQLIPTFQAAGDWCAEHGYPESACPLCNPMTPPAGISAPDLSPIAEGTIIRFRSPELERAAGIRVARSLEAGAGGGDGIECTARIEFDGNRVADILAPIAGVVRAVRVDLGAVVAKDATLFVLESPAVGEIQGRYRAARQRVEVARADMERRQRLFDAGATPAREVDLARQEFEAAQAELESAEASLRMTGAPAEGSDGRCELRSPIAGTVVRRPAMVGTYATDETSLATVADTRVMWALLDIGEADAARVSTGALVTVHVGDLGDVAGRITWISAEVDARTRTVSARAEVPNPDGRLRANQFARATVRAPGMVGAVELPRDAVQRLGGETVVFVRTGEGEYEPRLVTVIRTTGDAVHVNGEVGAGEPVVVEGAYLLKTELSRDSIGAGCCEIGTRTAER